jgi:hypothetical protein
VSGRTAVVSQPRFLPAPNYFHRMMLADVFVILDTVQYTPRDWENRNRILGAQGPQWLTVPVVHVSRSQLIRETRIDNAQDWRSKHLRTLEAAYGKAPHYASTMRLLESLYGASWDRLLDLDRHFIDAAVRELGIRCEFVLASDLVAEGKGQALLMSLCRAAGADTYLSGALGRAYLRPEDWAAAGIRLRYHDYESAAYPQLAPGFTPWMSVIDMMMSCGPETRDVLARDQPAPKDAAGGA